MPANTRPRSRVIAAGSSKLQRQLWQPQRLVSANSEHEPKLCMPSSTACLRLHALPASETVSGNPNARSGRCGKTHDLALGIAAWQVLSIAYACLRPHAADEPW